jgi:antitoxin VapB
MALNIKDKETVELAAEVAEMTGATKTGAVRQALRERRDRLRLRGVGGKPTSGRLTMQEWLEVEIWPQVPEQERGKPPLSKAEVEEILGYGPEGH